MGDFIFDGNDGNFQIQSGSNAVPVFKVDGDTVEISGSLIPGEAHSGSAISELGSIDHPWKELYVESASINFVDTALPSGNASRRVKFSKTDVDDLKAGRMPGNVAPLSRFSYQIGLSGRITAVNTWYTKGAPERNLFSIALATSDPNGTNIPAKHGILSNSFVAPKNCRIRNAYVTMFNSRNSDNIILTIFKGSLATDSNTAVEINRMGSIFAPTMTINKTYIASQDFTSGNAMSAGDFLLFTLHVTSYSSTSYPNLTVTLDGEYQ